MGGFSGRFDTIKRDLDFLKNGYSGVFDLVQSVTDGKGTTYKEKILFAKNTKTFLSRWTEKALNSHKSRHSGNIICCTKYPEDCV